MAEQSEPVKRRVALKVIKLGMDTKSVIARFEAERQALALMDHPNIAKVLDGGATDAGRPYFVMELVRGTKITEYCDPATLIMAERNGEVWKGLGVLTGGREPMAAWSVFLDRKRPCAARTSLRRVHSRLCRF
jgi:hypothetical protein